MGRDSPSTRRATPTLRRRLATLLALAIVPILSGAVLADASPDPPPTGGAPSVLAPRDESIRRLIADIVRTAAPVPGTLDLHAPSDGALPRPAVTLRADRTGTIVDVRVGATSLSDLRAQALEGTLIRCTTGTAEEDARSPVSLDRLTPSPSRCVEDLLLLSGLANGLEEGFRGELPDTGFRAGRNGPPPDRFCALPVSKDCDALREDREMAQLSQCVYRKGDPCPAGWEAVTPESLGLDHSLFHVGEFDAELFHDPTTDQYVLAFRGSDSIADFKDNLRQGIFGTTTGQYDQALKLTDKLLDRLALTGDPLDLRITGHSLGGGLATLSALRAGRTATVFNPASLHDDLIDEHHLPIGTADATIDVITVKGEIVTSVQGEGHRAPGHHTALPRAPGYLSWQQLELHGMDSVNASLDTYLDRHCTR